jgi:hypothetical protein
MSEALDRLKNIGAQKIYEETHIPIEHVQAILHESFDGFSKVQFLGFISILEREYNEDLSDLRTRGLGNFEVELEDEEQESLFVLPQKKKNYTLIYVALAIFLFLLVGYFSIGPASQPQETPAIDNSVIEDAKETLELIENNESNRSDINKSAVDVNHSIMETNSTETKTAQEQKVEKSLKFVTKTKIWLGYIDLETNKHHNKIFTGEFSIDPENDWLLVFGHGYVDIVVNDELMEFHSRNKVRFLYKDGEMKAISLKEFKRLNRGLSW